MSLPRAHTLKDLVTDVKKRIIGSQTDRKEGEVMDQEKSRVHAAQESNAGEVSEHPNQLSA